VSERSYPVVHGARILQIMPAPCALADKYGNAYVGYALVELDLEWPDGSRDLGRDILPFGPEGGIIGAPGDSYYGLHALGDDRPDYASFVALEAEAA
jgi:hypothetical protein